MNNILRIEKFVSQGFLISLLALGLLTPGTLGCAPEGRDGSEFSAAQSGNPNTPKSPFKPLSESPTSVPFPSSPTVSPDQEAPEGRAPYEFTIQGTGFKTPVSITVQTKTILKVQFSPNPQDRNIANTGYSINYGMLGGWIYAGENAATKRETHILNNGLHFAKEKSPILNFSNQIPKTCPQTVSAVMDQVLTSEDEEITDEHIEQAQAILDQCRETVQITMIDPQYDIFHRFCDPNLYYARGLCPLYETHPWNGTLFVETDDTGVLK